MSAIPPMHHVRRRIALATLVLLATAVWAAEPNAWDLGMPVMTVYNAAEHRGGPQTFDAAQDANGILYFGNLHGLLTYDGAWWGMTKLPDAQVPLSLTRDAAGRMAVGLVNDFGVLDVDKEGGLRFDSWVALLPPARRQVGDVRDVCGLPGGGFLFVTETGLILSDGRSARSVDGFDAATVPRGCDTAGDSVLLRSRSGLSHLDLRTLQLVPRVSGRNVRAIMRDRAGAVHIGTAEEGVFAVDGDALVPWGPESHRWLKGKDITGGVFLPDGRIAITTRQNGVLILRPDQSIERVIDESAGLPNAILNEPFVDRAGSLWLVMEGPLVRIDVASSVTVFDERIGLQGQVSDVVRHRGTLYVTTSHGLFVIDGSGRAAVVPGISGGAWRMLSVGDELLICASDGVYRLDGTGTITKVDESVVADLRQSPSDPSRVWLAGEEGFGSLRRTEKGWNRAGSIKGARLAGATVVERFGVLWGGTVFNGVVRIEDPVGPAPRVTQYGSGEMSAHDVDGRVVLVDATAGRILQPADVTTASGKLEHKLVPDPALGHVTAPGEFFFVAQDARGNVWINSIPPRVVRRRADGGFDGEARPLAPVSSSDIQTIRTDSDGSVWFGSDRGLFRYAPSRDAETSQQPAPLIRRVATANGTLVFGGWSSAPVESTRLAPDFGRIRFDFAPATYLPGVTYQYRLDPADKDWSEWTAQATIDFTTLSPGRYVLRVRARAASGGPSPETRWAFSVMPPWHRTWWAVTLWSVIALAIVLAVFRLRTRSLRQHAEELKERVAEKTARLQETVGMLEQANHELQEAQEKIARFNESSGEALRDVRAWSKATASDLAASVHAEQIVVSIVSGGELIPVAPTEIRPPRLHDLETLPRKSAIVTGSEGHSVIAVPGLTGRVFGALTVVGKSGTWTDPERQLISTFAHQLGGALELQQVRNDLADARERNAAARRHMTDRGIALLKVCSRCSRCYDDAATRCEFDGAELDASRILPLRVAGRYRLVRLLGAGGMGEVFAGRDERLDRDVAVKVIKATHFNDADIRARFEREARAVARIHHPNVIAIHDSGELEEGSAYIVTELLDGCDLGYVLRRHGRGSPAQVASLIRQGAAALCAAHEAGLIHRDIKPANLFLVNGRDGFEVKLLDFGIAKTVDFESQLSVSGTLVGTPAYMAPEQVTRGQADRTTDLYSFAAVAYEALLGTRVSGNAGGFAALWDVMYSPAVAPTTLRPELSGAVDDAFGRALAKTPAERPDDIHAWATALASELETISTQEPAWPERMSKEEHASYTTLAATMALNDPA